MKTWSAEELFVRAYAATAVAAQGVWDVVKGVERITKPTRRAGGFDEDAAGEYLAAGVEPKCECFVTDEKYWFRYGSAVEPGSQMEWNPDCPVHRDDTPNPTEPGLDDNELVGVRQLIEERFGEEQNPFIVRLAERITSIEQLAQVKRISESLRDSNTSASVKSTPGTGAGTASPAASAAGDSPSDACGIPPSPSEGRPPHPVPRQQRQGTYCEDYETDGCSVDVCPEGCWQALKMRDDAAAEWIGGAVPVISAVLSEHRPAVDYTGVYCNTNSDDGPHDHYENWAAWHAHISPLIANALAPQPKPAFPETGLDMGARLDGCTFAADTFPQHTKHQK